MKLLVPLCAALALSSQTPDELRFAPAEGLALTRVWEKVEETRVQSVQLLVDGEDRTPAALRERRPVTTRRDRLVVEDRIGVLNLLWPGQLERRFVEISRQETTVLPAREGAAEEENKRSARSPLQGREVVFLWSDEEGRFLVTYRAGSRGPAKALEGLEEDLDLRGFLPRGPVAAGAEWIIDPRAFRTLLFPGGDLGVEWDGQERRLEELYRTTLAGELRGRYLGPTEVDGSVLGRVALEGRLEAGGELELGVENLGTSVKTLGRHWNLEVTGELLWDPLAGHLRSASVKAETRTSRVESDVIEEAAVGDGEDPEKRAIRIEHRLELAGSLAIDVRFESP